MATLIIHLTDAHVQQTDSSFPELAEKIAAAALSEVVNLDDVHIALTGDMVQSGRAPEYEIVKRFVRNLVEEIRSRRSITPWVVSCPGNHDCDFAGDQSVRDVIRKESLKNPAGLTDAQYAELAKPLSNYNSFSHDIGAEGEAVTRSCHVVDVGDVRYIVLNTALYSQNPERQGELRVVPPELAEVSKDGYSILLMHHPLNWIPSIDAKQVSMLAAKTADLVLLGHEHENAASAVMDHHELSQSTYLHGHILYGKSRLANSGFQTIVLNDDPGIRVRDYRFKDGIFALEREADIDSTKGSGSRLAFEHDFEESLEDLGANFTHRRKASIGLKDVFVWPELRATVPVRESQTSVLVGAFDDSHDVLIDRCAELPGVVVIQGGEEYGKTALSKAMTKSLEGAGYVPLLLSGKKLPSLMESRLGKRVDSAIEVIYGKGSRDKFYQLDVEKKILIIDDFDLQALARDGFGGLRALKHGFKTIVLIVPSFPGVEVAINEFLRDESFFDSAVFSIAQLSYGKRHELIENWLHAGLEDHEVDEELGVTAARMARLVDETIGRNFIPSVPLFVLIILQRLELEHDLKTVVKSGAHGFLYEILINQALATHVKEGLDTVTNYLSKFAFKIYNSGADALPSTAVARFHADHCEEFDLEFSLSHFIAELVRAKILVDNGKDVRFKLPAHYYYFLSKELSKKGWDELNPIVSELVREIHTEKAANVLLFLAHFSRSPEVAALLLQTAKATLANYTPFDIFATDSPISKRSVREIRAVLLDGAKAEIIREAASDSAIADEGRHQLEAAAQARLKSKLKDALAMNAAFKTLQILGQLLRNSAGSLRRDQKREIASECAQLGLRVLGFLHQVITENSNELLEFRGLQLRDDFARRKKDGSVYFTKNEAEIAALLENYLPALFANLTVGSILRVTNALGSEELLPTLSAVLSGKKTDQVILLATKLEHFSGLDYTELKAFKREDLGDQDILGYAVLRRFLSRRLMMFPVPREIKESIAAEFDLSTAKFRLSGASRAALSQVRQRG